jgi:hypothetical protein
MADTLGLIIRCLVGILGIYIVVCGQVAGLLIIVPALLVDYFIDLFGIKATSSFSNAIKAMLLVQALLVWFVIQSQNSAMQLFSRPLDSPTVFPHHHRVLSRKFSGSSETDESHQGHESLLTEEEIKVKTYELEEWDSPMTDLIPAEYVPDHDPIAVKAASAFKEENQYIDPESTHWYLHPLSHNMLLGMFDGATLPMVPHADLAYRCPRKVRALYANIFDNEVPSIGSFNSESAADMPLSIPPPNMGFDERFKNPCFTYRLSDFSDTAAAVNDAVAIDGAVPSRSRAAKKGEQPGDDYVVKTKQTDPANDGALACLPYVYMLGQPRCGTSDLFERLKRHSEVSAPERKEIRWFTRGEFDSGKPGVEVGNEDYVRYGVLIRVCVRSRIVQDTSRLLASATTARYLRTLTVSIEPPTEFVINRRMSSLSMEDRILCGKQQMF